MHQMPWDQEMSTSCLKELQPIQNLSKPILQQFILDRKDHPYQEVTTNLVRGLLHYKISCPKKNVTLSLSLVQEKDTKEAWMLERKNLMDHLVPMNLRIVPPKTLGARMTATTIPSPKTLLLALKTLPESQKQTQKTSSCSNTRSDNSTAPTTITSNTKSIDNPVFACSLSFCTSTTWKKVAAPGFHNWILPYNPNEDKSSFGPVSTTTIQTSRIQPPNTKPCLLRRVSSTPPMPGCTCVTLKHPTTMDADDQ
mmetsp:Transcript_28535/g.43875  ORF Transcript_28535/g.43875 Transcript_28535/m.43875 type:complete len:253 (+) Transcript_28535:712-1470(+)